MTKNLTCYSWWGGDNDPPPNFKTKNQLAEVNLRGVKAVGRIETKRYTVLLFDSDDRTSVAPKRQATQKQLEALAKNRDIARAKRLERDWYKYNGEPLADRNYAIEWARSVFTQIDNWVILDTETTGLDAAQIVQIGILNLRGEVILDSLVKPTIPIPIEVSNIHGITDMMLVDAPDFATIYPQIKSVLSDKKIAIYNKSFDLNVLENCCRINNCEPIKGIKNNTDCVMEWYSQYIGDWSEYYQSYRWQSLPGSDHSAIGDCRATLAVVYAMATAEIVDKATALEKYRKDLE
jgi:DNA polymerase III subunit epsilon